ncbi:hypothetical protein RDWZM_000689 [Blomia tropicalis]|uniref:EFR3-like protein n=1 Tax=Blomia tropicalis TaxID=40697 RepID=A0A9Q0RPU5_BLOTA|nr:hypothetical protein RDWZM_000689 [Blomia tropicalis]
MSIGCCLNVDLFGGLFSRCDTSQCCCSCCCSPFRARYKRLVDNIFPTNYEDGLVKSNMEKLIFYALSSPEKLDRIGSYLEERISRDLSRHRIGFVEISIEAMDQLLLSCHSLNLFVQSYLKVVQLVLESQDPDLQVLATHSFVKFANIEEDTPSYHRSYDFFVCKFSSLCHSNNNDLKKRKQLRVAGLIGIRGLIRKTVSDDLQVDIWNEVHMEKIIPSLLFNMQCKEFDARDGDDNPRGVSVTSDSRSSDNDPPSNPHVIAEECLRELMSRATFGNVKTILNPIINHLDSHGLWEATVGNPPDRFAIDTFEIIIFSIPAQHSYNAVQMLLSHLKESRARYEEPNQNRIKMRTGIVNVLKQIISIAISQSIGPSVLDIISSLIFQLRDSINNINAKRFVEDEKLFQETVINTLGEFAANLPVYQKIESMIFIIEKAPPSSATSATDIQLQNMILKSLLKVTTKYKPVSMSQTLPSGLLSQLLSRALAPDPKVRVTVQKIFHQLLDRHHNLSRLIEPTTIKAPEQLTIEKADQSDLNFIKRYAHGILINIYNNIQIDTNEQENYDSIYTTMALICIEMNSEEVLIDLIRLSFAIQDLATSKNSNITDTQRCHFHALVAGFLNLFSHLKAIPAICTHVEQVIKNRVFQAEHLLPEFSNQINSLKGDVLPEIKPTGDDSSSNKESRENSIADEFLFNRNVISEALQTTGHDVSAIANPFPSSNDVDSSMTRSISDLNAITLEIDSVNSSPGVGRKAPEQEITFATFKEILVNSDKDTQQETQRRRNMLSQFRTSKFEDLVDNYQIPNDNLYDKLLSSIDKSFEVIQSMKSNDSSNVDLTSQVSDQMDNELPINNINSKTLVDNNQSRDRSNHFSNNWHIYKNPLLSFCDVSEVNSRGPPLFALRFPDLFVY